MSKNKHDQKILLVDDEPNILLALDFLISQAGYQVQKAANGDAALQKAKNWLPNVIVLDVMMPGKDGFEVAKEIRSLSPLDNTRIIFLTAKGTQEDRFKGYETGAEIYLTKPFDNDELIETINEVVEYG